MADSIQVKDPEAATEGNEQDELLRLLHGNHYLRRTWLPLLALPLSLSCIASAPAAPGLIAVGLLRRLSGGDSVFSGSRPGRVHRNASKTAMFVAAVRYIGYREGWTDDKLSRYFLPPELAWAIDWTWAYSSWYQLSLKTMGYLMARTLAGDNLITNLKPKQIVLLGAGLDTRAHRLQLSEGTRVYEIDIGTTQAYKIGVASKHSKLFRGHVEYVAVDFANESFMEKLKQAPGFDINCSETLFLFEGVSMYLLWDALKETLTTISSQMARGTYVGMDVLEDFVTTKDARRRASKYPHARGLSMFVRHLGEPFKWGIPIGATVKDLFLPLGYETVLDARPTMINQLFFTPKTSSGAQARRPIAHCPEYGHYVILRVGPKGAQSD